MNLRKKLTISVRLEIDLARDSITPVRITLSGPAYPSPRVSVAVGYEYADATAMTPRFRPSKKGTLRRFIGLLVDRLLIGGQLHPNLKTDENKIHSLAYKARNAVDGAHSPEWVLSIFGDKWRYTDLFQAVEGQNKQLRLRDDALVESDCVFELVDTEGNSITTLRPPNKPSQPGSSVERIDLEIAVYLCNRFICPDEACPVPEVLKKCPQDIYPVADSESIGLPGIHLHEIPNLIGREADIQSLIKRLEQRPANRIACEGLPGVGKTSVLTHIAHRLNRQYTVLWCSLGPDPDFNEILRLWAQTLDVPTDQYSGNLSTQQLHRLVKLAVSKQRTVIIIDDVWSASAVIPLLVGDEKSHTLFSSRFSSVACEIDEEQTPYSLPVLGQTQAIELFHKIAPDLAQAHEASINELVPLLGRLPLAIVCVAGALAQVPHIEGKQAIDGAIQRLKTASVRLREPKLTDADLARNPSLRENSVLESVSLSLDLLNPEQQQAFKQLSTLRPQPEVFTESLAHALLGEDARSLLSGLQRVGLVRKAGPNNLHIHPVLADSGTLLQSNMELQTHRMALSAYFEDGLAEAIEPLSSTARAYAGRHYTDRHQLRLCYKQTRDHGAWEHAIEIAAASFIVEGAKGKIQDQLEWGHPVLQELQSTQCFTLPAAYLCGGMMAWACWMSGQFEQANTSAKLALQFSEKLDGTDKHLIRCIAHHNLHKSALMQMLSIDSDQKTMCPSHPKWKQYLPCVREAWENALACEEHAKTYRDQSDPQSSLPGILFGMASGNLAYMYVALEEFKLALKVFTIRHSVVMKEGNDEQIAARHLDLVTALAGIAKKAKNEEQEEAIVEATSSLNEVFELIKVKRIRRKDIHREYRQMRAFISTLPSSSTSETSARHRNSDRGNEPTQLTFARLLKRPIREAAKKATQIEIDPARYDL